MSDRIVGRDVAAPVRPRARRRLPFRHLAFAAAGLALLGGAVDYGYDWWTVGRFIETTDDAYVAGDVTPIAPHVGGFVQKILVADNQRVMAGQTLLRLDPRDFEAALSHAEAVLQARQAALANLQAKTVLQKSVIAAATAERSPASAFSALWRDPAAASASAR